MTAKADDTDTAPDRGLAGVRELGAEEACEFPRPECASGSFHGFPRMNWKVALFRAERNRRKSGPPRRTRHHAGIGEMPDAALSAGELPGCADNLELCIEDRHEDPHR
jgi:hypothetical protein